MNLTQNILTTLSARLITLVLALLSSILLARILGPEGRGLFALILLLPELATTFGLLCFDQANAVYAGLEPQRRRVLVWHSAVIAGVVGGGGMIVGAWYLILGAPGFPALRQGPLWLFLLSLSVVPAKMLVEYWLAILRGMNRILLLNVVEVGTKVVGLLLLWMLIGWLDLEVVGAVWTDAMIPVGSVVLSVILLRHVGVWGRPDFDRDLWQRTKRFALPMYSSTIMSYLNYRIDQIIIAVLLPPEQLGLYVIAVSLGERLWILTGAVANALLPHLTNSQGRDPVLPAIIARHVMVWTGAACLLCVVLADVVIPLLYSSAFAQAVSPFRWLLPGILTFSVGKVLVAELLAREKPYYSIWSAGIGALVNIIGNILLIPHMGISGAALASSLSYTCTSLVITWAYLRETGLSWTVLVPCRRDLLPYIALWHRFTYVIRLESSVAGDR
jgi:O-antigen/teichoic acid export membrane protein